MTNTEKPEVRVDLRMPPELKAELLTLSKARRQSLNSCILTLLEHYLRQGK